MRGVRGLVLASIVLLSGCGGGDDGGSEGAAPPSAPSSVAPTAPAPVTSGPTVTPLRPSAPAPQVSASFAACMRKHGVQTPGKGENWTPPPNIDQAKLQKAFAECMHALTPTAPAQ